MRILSVILSWTLLAGLVAGCQSPTYSTAVPTVTYTVTYDANGASGSVPTDATSYKSQQTFTLPGPGALTLTGYTFAGWSTVKSGGTVYSASTTFTVGSANVVLYAQWIPGNSTVTFDGNQATGGTPPVPVSQAVNTSYTIPGNTGNLVKTGFTFAGWNTSTSGTGAAYSAGSTYQFTASSVTLYAQWSSGQYSVSFDPNLGTGVAPPTITQMYGTSVTIPGSGTLAKTGYTFAGWNTKPDGTGTNYTQGSSLNLGSANVNLYANWSANLNAITFNSNGGSGSMGTQNVYTGATVNLNVCSLYYVGYTFAGWGLTSGGPVIYSNGGPFTMGTGPVTLYAQWNVNTYAVTFDPNGGTGSMSVQNLASGAKANLYTGTYTRAGYTFTGWNTAPLGGGTAYADGATYTMAASSVTLYAQWSANLNTIKFDPNGGTGSPASQTLATGSHANLTVHTCTRSGYSFNGWNTTADGLGTSYADNASYTMGPVSVILYAQWSPTTQTITFVSNGGSGTMASLSWATGYSDYLPVNAFTKAGSNFAGWVSGSGASYSDHALFVMGTSNVVLTAQWSTGLYTLSYDGNQNTGGTVPPSITKATNYQYNIDGPSSLVRTGYTFAHWTTVSDGTGATYNTGDLFTFGTSNVTLYAQWTANHNTISFDPNHDSAPVTKTQGMDTAASGSLNANAYSRPGYTFTGWNTTSGGTGTPYADNGTYTMGTAASVTLYAQWTPNNNTITFDPNHDSVQPNQSQTMTTGFQGNLNANSYLRTGYYFTGWNTNPDGSGTPYPNTSTYTMGTSNVTLYAQWRPVGTITVGIQLASYQKLAFATPYPTMAVNTTLNLSPSFTGTNWQWTVNGAAPSSGSSLAFTPNAPGIYNIGLLVLSGGVVYSGSVTVTVTQ